MTAFLPQATLIVLQCLGLFLLADFIGGLVHWAEDTLGEATTPIWGPLFVRPNERHHDDPGFILQVPWWRGTSLAVLALSVVGACFWAAWGLGWQYVVFAAFSVFQDHCHRYAHMPTARLPGWVRALQRARVMQSGRDHWRHHRPPHNISFCVMTPWLNPVLDWLGFWRLLDRLFVPVFGAPRRDDLAGEYWYRPRA